MASTIVDLRETTVRTNYRRLPDYLVTAQALPYIGLRSRPDIAEMLGVP